jgi:prepilin-type processing-associated H-X9-DG protein
MDGLVFKSRRSAFTLVELLVVVGLIALLLALLLPVTSKARAAANSTACLSNLRQMAVGWSVYLGENKGRLPEYVQSTPLTPEIAWRGYWLGILEDYKIKSSKILCPAANEPISINQANRGFGNIKYAWTGKYLSNGSVARFSPALYRDGSYGYNRYLTVGNGFGSDGKGTRITGVRPLSEVPAFLDAVFLDFAPKNGSELAPVDPPPNLRGHDFPPTAPDHWRFLIARHGRGINIAMADGSARWVPLENTYQLTWKTNWQRYRLSLPMY